MMTYPPPTVNALMRKVELKSFQKNFASRTSLCVDPVSMRYALLSNISFIIALPAPAEKSKV